MPDQPILLYFISVIISAFRFKIPNELVSTGVRKVLPITDRDGPEGE
jgi:hypothetical protein